VVNKRNGSPGTGEGAERPNTTGAAAPLPRRRPGPPTSEETAAPVAAHEHARATTNETAARAARAGRARRAPASGQERDDNVVVTWAGSASPGLTGTILTGEHVLGPIPSPDTADPWGTPAISVPADPAPAPDTGRAFAPAPWPAVTTPRSDAPPQDMTRITSEHPALTNLGGPGTVAMVTAEHVALAVAGDAFDTFYRSEKPRVVAVVSSLTGDRAAAEDIVQEAFATAMRRWATVSGYDRPGDWVKRVAVNRAISRFRRRQSESRALTKLVGQSPDDDLARPPGGPGDAWDDDPLWSAVRRLPRRQAQAVVLVYVDDLSLERVAEILQCSVGSVKTHLYRARQRLAAELGTAPAGDEAGA
jgi:RNA polymerase sigma-70 factor (ECF subfamily)